MRGLLTLLYLVFALGPILWIVQMSLKPDVEAFRMPPRLIFIPYLTNYSDVLHGTFLTSLVHSVEASTTTTSLSLLVGVPAAYALSRVRVRRHELIRFWILVSRLAPPIAVALPTYLAFRALNLVDTIAGLTLVYLTFNLSLVIWLSQSFFDSLPKALEEAAYLDGAGVWRTLLYVTLPLAVPGIAIAGIFSFLLAWNDFFFALILTRSDALTAPVAIMGYVSFLGWQWGKIAAASTLVMCPSLLFAIVVRKYMISGLTAGALRE